MTVWIRARIVKRSQRNPRGKTYAVLFRRGGRMYRVESAGTFPVKKEAQVRKDLIGGWLAQGLDPKAELAKLKKVEIRRTFEQWGDLWLASRVDLSLGAYKAYKWQLQAVVKTLGKIDPLLYTPAEAQEWIAKHSDLTPSTISTYVGIIMQVFDYTGMKDNPWRDRKVRKPRQKRKEINPPTAEHMIAILERIPVAAILPLAVMEQDGSRIGETLGLAFGDFDENGRRIRFRSETTKSGKPRWANLPEWLNEALGRTCPREDRTPDRLIFPDITAERVRVWMRQACRDAGIPNYHPHDLRHRRASLWHGQNVPAAEVTARIGHASTSITHDTYTHVMPLEEIPVETWLRLIGRAQVGIAKPVSPSYAPNLKEGKG